MSERRLALRVAPQRNTQYQALARDLAEPEVRRSPLRHHLASVERRAIGDADWLILELAGDVGAPVLDRTLALLAATSDAFWVDGSSWEPIPVAKAAAVPRSMIETRRYSGKTNELFTRLMVNLATFDRDRARVLDPLCGGGTSLFAALERGLSAVGADADKSAVEGTAQFVRQFCREHRIRCRQREERHKGRGRDWHHDLDLSGDPVQLSLLQASAQQVTGVLAGAPGGARAHAVVADLPYGIQHVGEVADLVDQVVAVSDAVLTGDGVAVLAWNASRIALDDLVGRVDLRRFDLEPSDDLAHRVDRVIKRREVLVLRRRRS